MTILRKAGIILLLLFLFRAVTSMPEESANIVKGLFHLLISFVAGIFTMFDAIIGAIG